MSARVKETYFPKQNERKEFRMWKCAHMECLTETLNSKKKIFFGFPVLLFIYFLFYFSSVIKHRYETLWDPGGCGS